jgi:hypothetical protein
MRRLVMSAMTVALAGAIGMTAQSQDTGLPVNPIAMF